MTLPLALAEKLLLLLQGEKLPASKVKHALINDLTAEGIITDWRVGRTKSVLLVTNAIALKDFLYNRYAIPDLNAYVRAAKEKEASRARFVEVASDSKAGKSRTFKGFLINSYEPVSVMLHGTPLVIQPAEGTFQFIFDYENFLPASDTVIIGIENAENFCSIKKQHYLFPDVRALFVCRYPQNQSKDLIKWLQKIPNPYWHFGDYDFAGINIYQQEYKKYLGDKASFFVPQNFEELLRKYGNRNLYDLQKLNASGWRGDELEILIGLLHKYKKGLEQEALLINR